MNKFHIEKGQCVYINWVDSATIGRGWVYDDDDLKVHLKRIESVGFVCDVADNAVMIAGTRSESGGVVTPLTIPIGCIEACKFIEF